MEPINVKVAFVGDSSTRGIAGDGFNGYRNKLNTNFQADRVAAGVDARVQLSYIGSQVSGSAPADHHFGFNGSGTGSHTVAEITAAGMGDPDVIVLLTGHADALAGGASVSGFTATYMGVVNNYHAAFPNAVFVVMNLLHSPPPGTAQADYDNVSAQLVSCWSTMQGSGIPTYVVANGPEALVWTGDGSGSGDYAADDQHPSPTGFTKIANAARTSFVNAVKAAS